LYEAKGRKREQLEIELELAAAAGSEAPVADAAVAAAAADAGANSGTVGSSADADVIDARGDDRDRNVIGVLPLPGARGGMPNAAPLFPSCVLNPKCVLNAAAGWEGGGWVERGCCC
jgi:hypothetical protein